MPKTKHKILTQNRTTNKTRGKKMTKQNECIICHKKEFTTIIIPKYVCDKCFEKELLNK